MKSLLSFVWESEMRGFDLRRFYSSNDLLYVELVKSA